MHNLESVLKNETHKLLWDFEIQTDHLISARRPDLIIINNNKKKRTCKTVNIAVPTDHRMKLKEREKDKYLDLAWELKKTVKHESDFYTISNWCSWYSHRRIGTGTGGLGNKRTSGEHPNYSNVEISQKIEKSPGDLKRFAVTPTSVKDHQRTLMWKTQGVK